MIVSVLPVAGAVIVTLLMLVAEATPKVGVVADRFVTVVPLGSARTPVELALIAALPLLEPFQVIEPPSEIVKPPAWVESPSVGV